MLCSKSSDRSSLRRRPFGLMGYSRLGGSAPYSSRETLHLRIDGGASTRQAEAKVLLSRRIINGARFMLVSCVAVSHPSEGAFGMNRILPLSVAGAILLLMGSTVAR